MFTHRKSLINNVPGKSKWMIQNSEAKRAARLSARKRLCMPTRNLDNSSVNRGAFKQQLMLAETKGILNYEYEVLNDCFHIGIYQKK